MIKILFLILAHLLVFYFTAGYPNKMDDSYYDDPGCDDSNYWKYSRGWDNPCVWTWGSCSNTCGPGIQVPVITQHAGRCVNPCSLPSPRKCSLGACIPSCVWGQWNTWGSCTVSCGGGSRVRTRSKIRDFNCVGAIHQTQPCSNQCCPVDCKWGSWGDYGVCSASCGKGAKVRSRTKEVTAKCGGLECVGSHEEISLCNDKCCAIDCEMSPWSFWSPCTETCGLSGVSFREREVKKQAQCGGLCPYKLKEEIPCNLICLNGGVIDSVNHRCMCGKGWEGKCCEEEIKCEDDESVCDVNAVCLLNECHCTPGFHADGKTCADVNECTLETHDCSVNAKCKNTDGAFDCECFHGYHGDGFQCQDMDECELRTDSCHASAACINTDGSFDCLCFPGFHGDGFNCTQGCTNEELPKIKGRGFYEEEFEEVFGIGEKANLQCEEGYKPSGATTTTCTEYGFDNEDSMICVKDCKDRHKQCGRWKKRGYCELGSHKLFMVHFCSKSCKLC